MVLGNEVVTRGILIYRQDKAIEPISRDGAPSASLFSAIDLMIRSLCGLPLLQVSPAFLISGAKER
jgi:hypothetical protein